MCAHARARAEDIKLQIMMVEACILFFCFFMKVVI